MTPLNNPYHIKRCQISSIEDALFEQAWTLYETSFTVNERRMIHDQKRIMNHPSYHFETLILEEGFLGILLWWEFEQLSYVEHFAIADAYKSKGYGSLVMTEFISLQKDPILLEVEIPKDELQQRRIAFYKRIGFQMNPYPYIQPAYSKAADAVPLLLMSWPKAIDQETFQYFTSYCHSLVFSEKN